MSRRSDYQNATDIANFYISSLNPNQRVRKQDLVMALARGTALVPDGVALSSYQLDSLVNDFVDSGKLVRKTRRIILVAEPVVQPELETASSPGVFARIKQLEDDVADLRSQLASLRQRLL